MSPPVLEAQAPAKHVPALDGLRGISVLAVLLYHAEVPWLPGGFLGVDVFFVLSGFLITALLCREQLSHARVDLTGFYMRRIRRLMPALVSCLFATLGYVWLFLPDERNPVALDALSALTYTTNAHLVLGARGYFEEALRPSLLKHLWSLAVEEQFYLLYPPLCVALFLKLPVRVAAAISAVLAAFSGLRMAAVFDPLRDPSRAYYGTDSHAFGLLFGAALAFLLSRHSAERPQKSGLWAVVAPISTTALLAAFAVVDESERYVFEGGIFAVSCAAALLVASIGRGAPRALERGLSVRPLVWLGEISYSLYLWHWPVCVLLGAAVREWLPPSARIALIVGTSIALAAASRVLVELPFLRAQRRSPHKPAPAPERLALASGALLSVAAGVLLLWSDVVVKSPVPLVADASLLGAPSELPTLETAAPVAAGVAPDAGAGEALAELALDNAELAASAPERPERPPADRPGPAPEKPADKAGPDAGRAPAPVSAATFAEALLRRDCDRPFGLRPKLTNSRPEALAVGDSVMLGAARSIWAQNPRIEIDACVGRNAVAASQVLGERITSGPVPSTVIVHVGNNGGLNSAHLGAIMGSLSAAKRICFVTTRVPRRSQERTNATLRHAADGDPRVVVADWYALAEADESLFRPDGVHLTPQGARAYAALLVEQCLPPGAR